MIWLSDFVAEIPCKDCGDGEYKIVHNHISGQWISIGVSCLDCKAVDILKVNHAEVHDRVKAKRELKKLAGDS